MPFLIIETYILMFKNQIFTEEKLEQNHLKISNFFAWINLLESDSLSVISGSSTARYGLSCTELNRVSGKDSSYISIALDARDPIETYFILKNLNLNKIKNVYFGLDPWIYSKRYYKYRNIYLYLDFNLIECLFYYKEHDKSVLKKRYEAFFNYVFGTFDNSVNINYGIPSDFGSVSLNYTAINFNSLEDWFQIKKYGWSDLQFEYLKKMETFCNDKSINFFLFITPKRSDYSKYYFSDCIAAHHEYIRKLLDNNINSIVFGKYNLFDNEGDSTFFAEAYHLNQKGQMLFSDKFHEMINRDNVRISEDYSWGGE